MQTKEFSRRHWLVLLLFGAIGQIAWSVENMYFNLFVFDTIAPDLEAITLMVQLSGVTATVVTLIAGTLSDKAGMRRKFISIGYLIWGITVALFGFISPEIIDQIFNTGATKAIEIALVAVIAGDCVMTLFVPRILIYQVVCTDLPRSSTLLRVVGVDVSHEQPFQVIRFSLPDFE